jgi:hypothetical protein
MPCNELEQRPAMIEKDEDDRFEERISKHPHGATLAASTLSGAAAGAMVGAVAGPVSAAVGGLIGAAVGAAAGEVLEENGDEHDAHDNELDLIIGVEGGDIGARQPRSPKKP